MFNFNLGQHHCVDNMSDSVLVGTHDAHDATENHHSNGQVDLPVFREWVPFSHLIEKIPPRFHQGFVSKDLTLTCVNVSCDSIVLGSNAGVLFWFTRSNHNVTRKSVDDKFIPVTALAITLCQYGEVLAAGNLQGTVAIFSASNAQPTPVSVFNVHLFHTQLHFFELNRSHYSTVDTNPQLLLSAGMEVELTYYQVMKKAEYFLASLSTTPFIPSNKFCSKPRPSFNFDFTHWRTISCWFLR